MIPFILFLCFCFATKNVDGWMQNLSRSDDLYLEEQLKVINKPPIKSFQDEFGKTVDCIDINKQFAFDNPLLKDHTIQLKPSFENTPDAKSDDFSDIGMWNFVCPEGTVPVPRTTKEDLLRRQNNENITYGILSPGKPGLHFAELRIKFRDRVYMGIKGTLNPYNPPVGNGQTSSAYIWLTNIRNTIQVGWQVNPDFFGDKRTHFYGRWVNTLKHTGCTNYACPGFVQTSRRIFFGPVRYTSTYGGPQFNLSLTLIQDPATNNWWLTAHNLAVGYFPQAIFSNNLNYATGGGWTGSTSTKNTRNSPPMGCGHLPDDGNIGSCYVSKILFKNRFRQDFAPMRASVATYTDSPGCYNVKYLDYKNDDLQRSFVFGGPGGDCGI